MGHFRGDWRGAALGPGRAALLGAVGLLAAGCGAPGAVDAQTDPAAYAERIVAVTNDVRAADGLAALAVSACATDVALERAADQAAAGTLEHAPLDDVFDACQPYSTAAENLVDSAASSDDVVQAWMDSPGHRGNILDPDLTQVGVGCVASDSGLLCAQVFLGDG